MNSEYIDPWWLELIVVRGGPHHGAERRARSRDVERGLLHRVHQGVSVEAGAWHGLSAQQRNVVRMRALAAVSPETPVFSHDSAALVLGLPSDRRRLARLHVSGADAALTGRREVSGHAFAVPLDERVEVGGLLVTGPARTVVDVAATYSFDAGASGTPTTSSAAHALPDPTDPRRRPGTRRRLSDCSDHARGRNCR